MNERCEACRYWKVGGSATYVGLCHRFPKPYMKQPTDWCGEWKRKRVGIEPSVTPHVERVIPKTWCDQCEIRVTTDDAAKCKSRFCPVKDDA